MKSYYTTCSKGSGIFSSTDFFPGCYDVMDLLAEDELAAALELNNSMVANNTIEQNWIDASAIYINAHINYLNAVTEAESAETIDEEPAAIEFAFTDDEIAALENIAYQDGALGGYGVYMARAMLDTIIDKNVEELDGRLSGFAVDEILVYPNPATDLVRISIQNVKDGSSTNQLQTIELYNPIGIKINTGVISDYNTGYIDLMNLSSGFYTVILTMQSGVVYNRKIIISK